MNENQENHILNSINPELPAEMKGMSEKRYKELTPEKKAQLVNDAKKNKAKMDLVTDKGYYSVIVFQNSAQVKAFWKACNWILEEGDQYWIDGLKLAQHFDIELPKCDEEMLHKVYGTRHIDKKALKEADEKGLLYLE